MRDRNLRKYAEKGVGSAQDLPLSDHEGGDRGRTGPDEMVRFNQDTHIHGEVIFIVSDDLHLYIVVFEEFFELVHHGIAISGDE